MGIKDIEKSGEGITAMTRELCVKLRGEECVDMELTVGPGGGIVERTVK